MTRFGGAARLILALVAWSSLATAAPPPPRIERCAAAAERGQQERDRSAFIEARASFRACAADECPSLVRKDCAQWLGDVEPNIPSVVLGARDAAGNDVLDARILIDGKAYAKEEVDSGRSIELDPGPHVFRFEHAPDTPVELTIVLHTGERNRLVSGKLGTAAPSVPPAVTVPAPSTAPPQRPAPGARVTHVSTWAYVLGAVTLAGGTSFAYFGATGLSEKSQLRSQCGSTCSNAQVQPLEVKYITADASLGVGVISAAIAAWLFLHPEVEPAREPAASLAITPSRQGGGVSIVGRF